MIFSGIQNLDRYILMLYPGLIIVLAHGMGQINNIVSKYFKLKTAYVTVFLIVLVLFVTFSSAQIKYYNSFNYKSDIEELRAIKNYIEENSLITMCALLPCEFEFSSERCAYPGLRTHELINEYEHAYYIKTITEFSFGGCSGDYIMRNFNTVQVVKFGTIEIFEIKK